MSSTSAVYVAMRRRRAAKLVDERVDGVSVDEPAADGDVTVRLDEDDTWVATIAAADRQESGDEAPECRLEYADGGPSRVARRAKRIRRLLSRRAG